MSNQKIQFTLEFNADTKKAQAQLGKLQSTLDRAISSSMQNKDFGLTPKLEQARMAAMQLKVALDKATNVDTGKLNLRKFSRNLSEAGLSVNQLAIQMKQLGPEGVNAFNQMAQAVAVADTKLFSLQGSMKRLASTFFNTVRYQASASAINMVTSAISNAISFAQELDKSLTDIRIVTNKSAEEMARFAKQANIAARTLSTTTNKYAEASLIYFQQGYDVGEVMKRAETTIRLAHAVGKSAEEVSEWMTAIWNNFDNGTKSLEYYGDILARLGAETASSADEIAQGLSKFAAVAETVGLSYEYAASALATLTAETRESADVVGTALKTIFARMESLSLGETLDDGTTLGKYSLALKTVGVDIKDASGELKDMDQILDETATKWVTLSRDQQVALAQSVAGIRQYNQFIALMDKYDVMKNNLQLSKDSTGALREMEKAYKESVEGIKEESKAAREALSQSLIDEDDVKRFYKTLTKITDFVTKLVDAFGGLEGILLQVSHLLMKTHQPEVSKFFRNLGTTIKDTSISFTNFAKTQKTNAHNLKDLVSNKGQNQQTANLKLTSSQKTQRDIIEKSGELEASKYGNIANDLGLSEMTEKITKAKLLLQEQSAKLTPEQKQIREWQIETLENVKKRIVQEQEELQVLKDQNLALEDKLALAYDADQINKEQQKAVQQVDVQKLNKQKDKLVIKQQDNENKQVGLTETNNKIANLIERAKQEAVVYSGLKNKDKAEQRTSFGDTMGQDLALVEEEVAKLGFEVKDLGFLQAENAIEKFAHNGGSYIQTLIEKLEQVQNKIRETQDGLSTDMVQNTAAQMDIDRELGQGQEVTEIDRGYLGQRADVIGDMQGNANLALKKIKGIRGAQMTDEGKAKTGEEISGVLDAMVADAQKLEIDLEDLGFDKATLDLENFANAGQEEIDKLYLKLVKLKQAIDEAATAEIQKTKENAILGTQDATSAAFNTFDKASLSKSSEYTYSTKMSALEQLESSTGKEVKIKSADGTTDISAKKALKDTKIRLDTAKKEMAEAKKKNKVTKEQKDLVDKLEKEYKNLNKKINEKIKVMKKDYKATQDAIKATEGYDDAMELAGEEVENYTKNVAGVAEKGVEASDNIEALKGSAEGFGDNLNKIKASDVFAGIADGAMSAAAGFVAVQNGIANLNQAFTDGNSTMGDYLTSIMSVASGLGQMLAPMGKVIALMITKAIESRKAALQEAQNAEIENKAEQKKQRGKIATAMANVVEWFTKGPAGWIIGAVGLAALAAIGVGLAIHAGNKQSKEEQQEKENEKNREINAAATEVTSSLGGLSEQVDTFKNLRESGESTIDVLEDMSKTIDDIGFQIGELFEKGASKELFPGLTDLESKLQVGLDDLKSGRITADEYQTYIDEATKQTNQAIARTALSTAQASGWTDEDKTAYLSSVGTAITDSKDLMAQAEKEFLDNGPYSTVEEAQKAWGDAAINAALGPKYADLDSAESPEAIASLMSYAPLSVHRIINGIRMFAPNGVIANKHGTFVAIAAKEWAGSDVNKIAYANNIDFSKPEDTWDDQYQAAIDKEEEAKIIQSAEKLGYDNETFETYIDLLVDTNDQLKENDKTSKQLGLNNLKLNKGLTTLADSWKDLENVLASGQRGTIEYAQGLGKIKTALQEAFGYTPSTEFIEDNLYLIEQLAKGSTDALDELQEYVAKDMVANLDYRTSINDSITLPPEEIKNTLLSLIEDLSNQDIEIGADARISDNYLDALQGMLDSGQITADELDNIMRASGFEIEYDGWKTLPGPRSTVTRSITPSNGKPYTETITQEETLEVPIINGQVPKGIQTKGNANSVAKIVKSTDKSSVNASTFGGANENKDKEIERYHEIKEELSDIENELGRIDRAKGRAFGNQKLDLVDKQIKKQKELIEAEKIYQNQITEKLKEDASKLSSAFTLDENGRISNYTSALESLKSQLTSDEWDEVKKAADQYEETLNELEGQIDAVTEATNALLDLQLEEITLKVDFKLELDEDQFTIIEYQIEKIGDAWDKAADRFEQYTKKYETESNKIKTYQEGILGILNTNLNEENKIIAEDLSNPNAFAQKYLEALNDGQLIQEQIEQLRKYRDGLLESNQAMFEMRNTMQEELISAFQGYNEEIDKQTEAFERLNSTVEGYRNILDLVGDEIPGAKELINTMNRASVENSKNALESSRVTLEKNKADLQKAHAELLAAEKEGRTEDVDFWKGVVEELNDTVADSESEFMENWSNSLQAAADALADSVDQIIETFESAIAGMAGSLEELQSKYEQQEEIGARYLEDYEKIYNLSKLNRDITKSMDEQDSVKAKGKLRDLQEEIYALQESGAEMTQYEVDELRARYELRLAEIALEEAQNAKSQVQMRRDSEGNWSYIYTADQNKTSQAQQNVEDKMFALQQKNNSRVKEIEKQLVDINAEYVAAIQEVQEQEGLSNEERQHKLDEVTQYYRDKHQWLADQMQIALGNSKRLYDEDWTAYSNATGYKISSNVEWVDNFGETTYAQITGYDNLGIVQSSFESATSTMLTNLGKAYDQYKEDISGAMEAAGTSINEFSGKAIIDINLVKTASDNAKTSIEGVATAGSTSFSNLVQSAHTWLEKYNKETQPYIDQNEDWAQSINNIILEYGKLDDVKFDDLKKELQEVINLAKQAQGTTVASSAVTPSSTGTKFTTYSSAGAAEAAQKGDWGNLVESDTFGENDFVKSDFIGLDSSTLREKGMKKNGTTHYFTEDDITSLINSNWIKATSTNPKSETSTNKKLLDDTGYPANGIKLEGQDTIVYMVNNRAYSYEELSKAQSTKYSSSGMKLYSPTELEYEYQKKSIYSFDKGKEISVYTKTANNNFELAPDSSTELGLESFIIEYDLNNFAKDDNGNYYIQHPKQKTYWLPYTRSSVFSRKGDISDGFLRSFDTGGYTGTWDSSGRLAMLHQKEIVLNAHDTENFLSAVNIVRDIASVIDLRAAAQQSALAALATATTANHTMQTLQQEVTIHAEFPNATQRTEIEAAFDTLLNRASQFANRKN